MPITVGIRPEHLPPVGDRDAMLAADNVSFLLNHSTL
jgi:hypothetical protein